MALSGTDDRADAITRLLARRVAELRKSAGMNQAALGARMAELRPNWSRSTVVKLENNKRESVSVADLLALAVVLDVPLPWLLIDPKAGTAVPIAKGIDVDPWTALLWMIGQKPLTDDYSSGPAWDVAAETIGRAYQVVGAVKAFRRSRQHYETVAAFLPDGDHEQQAARADELDSSILAGLVAPLRALARSGSPLPPLPEDVLKRAVELDVELPGQGGEG